MQLHCPWQRTTNSGLSAYNHSGSEALRSTGLLPGPLLRAIWIQRRCRRAATSSSASRGHLCEVKLLLFAKCDLLLFVNGILSYLNFIAGYLAVLLVRLNLELLFAHFFTVYHSWNFLLLE